MKDVRLSHIILAVGRVDVRVEESRVRQGVESFKSFFFCVFSGFPKPFFPWRGGGGKGWCCFFGHV